MMRRRKKNNRKFSISTTMNKIILIGNVGTVQARTFNDGGKIVEVSLATTERYTNRNGEKVEDTTWHRCIIGGRLADVAEKYVARGDRLGVEGRQVYRKYTNRDGIEMQVGEVRVDSLDLQGRGKRREDDEPAPKAAPAPQVEDDDESDLPF
jgi:single-strand DNA-binding protein